MGSRRHLLVLLVTTLALTSAVPAQATVRFVSKAGADDNVCTVAPGCASLNYAMNWVSSGDEISIGAGTYDAPDSIFPNVPLDIHGDTAVDRSATKLRGPGSFIAVGSGGAGTHIHHLSFESTGTNFGAGALLAVNAPPLLEDLAISIDNAGNPVGRDAVSADVQLPSSGVVTLKDSTITANSNTSAPTVSAFNGQLVVRNVSISRTSGGSSPALGVIGSGNFPAATIDAKDVTISVDTGACINLSPQAGAGSIFD